LHVDWYSNPAVVERLGVVLVAAEWSCDDLIIDENDGFSGKNPSLPTDLQEIESRENNDIRYSVVVAHETYGHAAEFLLNGACTRGNVLPKEGIPDVCLVPALNHDAKGHEMRDIAIIDVGSQGIDD
jgi:hypothetical protein